MSYRLASIIVATLLGGSSSVVATALDEPIKPIPIVAKQDPAHQLGRAASHEDKQTIVQFLGTLTGVNAFSNGQAAP